MALFAPRKQQVGQLEVLAGVAPYMSCPGQLRGRDVIHFIDNTCALFGLTKGYYGEVDGARLVHASGRIRILGSLQKCPQRTPFSSV